MLTLITACSPGGPGGASPDPTDSPTPTAPAVTVLDEDVLLVVTATATAADGSALEYSMQVHRALAWDDPEAALLAALMTAGCEGSLEQSVYEENLWSFVAVDINSMRVGETRSSGESHRVDLRPTPSDELSLASQGAIFENDDVDIATPHCARSRYLDGVGESLLVVGLPGDSDDVGAAGQFTRWANAEYGYTAGPDVELSDCTFLLTEAGKELNGGADWWSETNSESACFIGAIPAI